MAFTFQRNIQKMEAAEQEAAAQEAAAVHQQDGVAADADDVSVSTKSR
eukprot:SAG31_NODE_122_length_23797_cov_39.343812_2_plen_48_part_00